MALPLKNHAVAEDFLKHGVVPDVVTIAPMTFLDISYASGARVQLGNELTPTQVKTSPTHVDWSAEPNSYYTLLMTDPDAPSRVDPSLGEIQHWLVVNIPGNDVYSGKVLTEYVGSGPPSGTGLHRYVFLVYKQPAGTMNFENQFISKTTREGRIKTSTEQFASKYGLGQPVAGNFYRAQYDDYVPELHKQLGAVPTPAAQK